MSYLASDEECNFGDWTFSSNYQDFSFGFLAIGAEAGNIDVQTVVSMPRIVPYLFPLLLEEANERKQKYYEILHVHSCSDSCLRND